MRSWDQNMKQVIENMWLTKIQIFYITAVQEYWLIKTTCSLRFVFFFVGLTCIYRKRSTLRSYFTAPSLCKIFFPLENSPLFLFGGHMQWGPGGSAGPHVGLPRARDVWMHSGRGCSSGWAQFSQWDLQ